MLLQEKELNCDEFMSDKTLLYTALSI